MPFHLEFTRVNAKRKFDFTLVVRVNTYKNSNLHLKFKFTYVKSNFY